MSGSKLFYKGVSVAQGSGERDARLTRSSFFSQTLGSAVCRVVGDCASASSSCYLPRERSARAGVFPGAVSFSSPAWSSPQHEV